jgi:hypothetical protein
MSRVWTAMLEMLWERFPPPVRNNVLLIFARTKSITNICFVRIIIPNI